MNFGYLALGINFRSNFAKWLKADGSFVNLDEALCEFESDKATLEFPSEASGRLIHKAKEGDDLKIGALVAQIDTSALAEPAGKPWLKIKNPATETPNNSSLETTHYAKGLASPAAAKMMEEHQIKNEQIQASGKDGRITKADVINRLENKLEESQPTKESSSHNIAFPETPELLKCLACDAALLNIWSQQNETAMLTTFNEGT